MSAILQAGASAQSCSEDAVTGGEANGEERATLGADDVGANDPASVVFLKVLLQRAVFGCFDSGAAQ